MAYITRFRVEGLAGKKDAYQMDLNADVNIFFGVNGSGKTSLLKILHSALSGDTSQLSHVPFSEARVSIRTESSETEFVRTIRRPAEGAHQVLVVDAGTGGAATRKTTTQWHSMPDSPKSGGWRDAYLPTSRLFVGLGAQSQTSGHFSFFAPNAVQSEEELDALFAKSIQQLWSQYSARTLSVVRKAQEDGLANILDIVLTRRVRKTESRELSADIAYKRVAAFLERQGSSRLKIPQHDAFAALYADNAQVRRVVEDIDRVEDHIERAMRPRNELANLVERMYGGNKAIHFQDTSIEVQTEDNHKIGLETLSSGEKHLLYLFVEVLRTGPNSCILIDEPEISLHIDWQRALMKALLTLNPRSQLIVATHSPEIMAEVPESQIFAL